MSKYINNKKERKVTKEDHLQHLIARMAGNIAAGIAEIDNDPYDVAKQSVKIALEIIERVESEVE